MSAPAESLRPSSPSTPAAPLLTITGLSKTFLGTQALTGVDFDVRPGEIHALLGQNGAGKSTLIKILAGVYPADSGTIEMGTSPDGSPVTTAFIHQDLGLVGAMTVAENIALVAGYQRPRGYISWRDTRRKAKAVLDRVGVELDPDEQVANLAAAERSMVAIARALALNARVLVLDEPTAALTEHDVNRLFEVLNTLRAQGIGMVYVSHRIDEVFRMSDRVTVLRDGRKVAQANTSDITPQQLIRWIVGRDIEAAHRRPTVGTEPVLSLDEVTVRNGAVGPVTLSVHSGEILGLVGLSGAGQNEIGRAILGAHPTNSGSYQLNGTPFEPTQPSTAIAHGIGFVSGDRVSESTAPELTVRENIYVNPTTRGFRRLSYMSAKRERDAAGLASKRFGIRPDDPERMIGALSGGNQQKAIVGRWLEADSRVLVLEEPTAGVDIGSKRAIHDLLMDVADAGGALLVVSADFEEVLALCHRALVFNRGAVTGEVDCRTATVADLTELSAGDRVPPEGEAES